MKESKNKIKSLEFRLKKKEKESKIYDDLLLYAYNLGVKDTLDKIKTTSKQVIERIKRKLV